MIGADAATVTSGRGAWTQPKRLISATLLLLVQAPSPPFDCGGTCGAAFSVSSPSQVCERVCVRVCTCVCVRMARQLCQHDLCEASVPSCCEVDHLSPAPSCYLRALQTIRRCRAVQHSRACSRRQTEP